MVFALFCDDMFSLRNFMDLFWHFDRVLKQLEGSRGVKKQEKTKELEATQRGAFDGIVTRFSW